MPSFPSLALLVKKTVILVALWGLFGCTKQLIQLVPPHMSQPKKGFMVIRDVDTTWNALLRALDSMGQTVHPDKKNAGKVVPEPTTVRLEAYCDCGRLGKVPLTGKVRRDTVIRLRKKAPHETMVEVVCRYSTKHKWKDIYGRVVRTEPITCVSNGEFERRLHNMVTSHLSP